MINIEWISIYLLIGSFVGFMGGLLGVGGGGILVPLLTSIFIYQGFPHQNVIHLALGTSLASMVFLSLSSIHAHASKGAILWTAVGWITPGILVGTFFITRIIIQVNSTIIALFLVLFMWLIAIQTFLNWRPKSSKSPATFGSYLILGILIGAISSVAAAGGGILSIMYLNYKNIEIKKAIGTSAALGLPISLAGTVGFTFNGLTVTDPGTYTLELIYVPAVLLISIASVFSAPYGVRFSQSLPQNTLKKIFAVLCVILGMKMLFQLQN